MHRIPKAIFIVLIAIIPFVVISVTISLQLFADTSPALNLLLNYAAVILSFMGGIHLGIAIMQHEENYIIRDLLIFQSVWPSILAWVLLHSMEPHIQLLILTLLYASLLAIDTLLYNNNLIPQWFYTLRCIITPIVVVSLYVAYFGII